jgi:hypothetical protein
MAHGRSQGTNRMGESMSQGHTDQDARRPVAGNRAVAGANTDLLLARYSTNGHGDRSSTASGERDGHTHSHMAPEKDVHTHTDKGHGGHCPTIESHQVSSRDDVTAQRQL